MAKPWGRRASTARAAAAADAAGLLSPLRRQQEASHSPDSRATHDSRSCAAAIGVSRHPVSSSGKPIALSRSSSAALTRRTSVRGGSGSGGAKSWRPGDGNLHGH